MNQDSPDQTTHQSVKDTPILRDPVFDNIKGLDQKRPNWWLITFYTAITFYIGWWLIYYNTDLMQNPTEKIHTDITAIDAKKQKELTAMIDRLDDKALIEWSQNSNIISEGEEIYKLHCIICHGADLGGGIGRSLTDAQWIYGGKPMDLFKLVLEGSPKDTKGFNGQKMQAWKDTLGSENVAKVTAFIISKSPSIQK
jgi:cytochrome c oxidase cbb3-type subunit 3